MPEINQPLFLQAIGVVFIAVGLAARFGLYKRWFWGARGGTYAYIPMGFMFILFTLNNWAEENLAQSVYYAFIGLFGLLAITCLWWSIKTPAFIKPTWVRWIEKHPRRIVRSMNAEVEAGEDWEEIVKTKKGVDGWAKSLKGKLPRKSKK